MIIESIFNPENCDSLHPLVISSYPYIDTLNFELTDLTMRPRIEIYTNPIHYAIILQFENQSIGIMSPYKSLIRHVFQYILRDLDVYEADLRRHFPELLI